jgi:hypothetical protein
MHAPLPFERAISFFLILTIGLFSCSGGKQIQKELSGDSILHKHFDKSEVRDLSRIVLFFDNFITSEYGTKEDSISLCYQRFMDSIEFQALYAKKVDTKLDQQGIDNLFSQIDSSTFNSIWYFSEGYSRPTKDSLIVLDISVLSPYAKFLFDLGKEDSNFSVYSNNFSMAGDISPIIATEIDLARTPFDFTNPRTRLAIAIHFITLSYPIYTTEGELWLPRFEK